MITKILKYFKLFCPIKFNKKTNHKNFKKQENFRQLPCNSCYTIKTSLLY